MSIRIGIDIGGTFTDLYWYNTKTGEKVSLSSPSTPGDFATGTLRVIEKSGIDLKEVDVIVHGTTVATNALIERDYPPVAFITTRGFRDLIEIGRYHRKTLYDPYQGKPETLVKRRHRFEVPERMGKDGKPVEELDLAALSEVVESIKGRGIDSVAIGFLNSYSNGRHEEEAKALVEKLFPDSYVAVSSQVLPKLGALGRFVTTIVNAGLCPVINRYVTGLENRLREKDFSGALLLVKSSGGMASAGSVRSSPEVLLGSGPVGGVVASTYLGGLAGYGDVITFDMGGTSCDISVIANSQPLMTTDYEIDWDMPIPIPVVDVKSIGAGGGSVAWIDRGGVMKVGPKSAGAEPGPVCYGRGGTAPTVTDANLVLGYLDPDYFLGGEMALNREGANLAMERLGDSLGLDTVSAAEGIVRIVNENMANALREVTVARGRDPRDFSLVAFGGAGSLHAVSVSERIGIPRVIVPPDPGTLCSFGDVCMDIRHEFECTFYAALEDVDCEEINARFSALDRQGMKSLKSEGVRPVSTRVEHSVAMRYVGQSYELDIPVPFEDFTPARLQELQMLFHRTHEQVYTVSDPEGPTEITNLRSTAIGKVQEVLVTPSPEVGPDPSQALAGRREVFLDGRFEEAPVYDRARLACGNSLSGPAIVQEQKATTLIPSGKCCHVDAFRNLVITNGEGKR